MATLIFDIETAGEDFEAMDSATQEVLTRWIRETSKTDEEYEHELSLLKNRLGFSPYTAEVVAIGVLDRERGKGKVYFQAPGKQVEPFDEGDFDYEPMGEKEMFAKFWQGAENYSEFVTFSGRMFDVPFLMVRSAIYKIKPTKDLMANRYIERQKYGPVHVDLQDQLSFYGAMRRSGGLHAAARAFGIESPKEGGVTGDEVGRLFAEKKYKEIARYNARDVAATAKLYDYWNKYLRF